MNNQTVTTARPYTASQIKFLETLHKLTLQSHVNDPNEDRLYQMTDFCEEYGIGTEYRADHSRMYKGYYCVQQEGLARIADVPLYLIPD